MVDVIRDLKDGSVTELDSIALTALLCTTLRAGSRTMEGGERWRGEGRREERRRKGERERERGRVRGKVRDEGQ